ncbi:hypothetical protein SP15_061 [Bacillus phage SP-15]|uniref:Uncharacterized protein n=1 Tax=Bacillus phage SP-15 TaxID=1792032 RepID=A0A127AW50_9CAUD|nr:hypothetical protein SP15_061 [Bacillus phage SP-15]AMM44860.1 hypothetical protein SP15_061 [Bacillus phage SP-15]
MAVSTAAKRIFNKKLQFGNLSFTYIGDTTIDFPKVTDIMVSRNGIYVVNTNFFTGITYYRKNANGTIGSLVESGRRWSGSEINEINQQNSSVSAAYTIYTDPRDGLDYLIGWSKSYARIFIFKLQDSIDDDSRNIKTIDTYTENIPKAIAPYSRAGWDGDHTIYFLDTADLTLYKFDIYDPSKGLIRIGQLKGYFQSNAYTGSGLFLSPDGSMLYLPGGAASIDYLLQVYLLTDYEDRNKKEGSIYQYSDQITYTDLNSIGSSSTLATGNVFYNHLDKVAYRTFWTASSIYNYRCVLTSDLANSFPYGINLTKADAEVHNGDYDLIFNTYPRVGSDPTPPSVYSYKFKILVNNVQAYPATPGYSGDNDILTNNILIIPNSYFKEVLGINWVEIWFRDNQGIVIYYFPVLSRNKPAVISLSIDKDEIHSEYVNFMANVSDEIGDTLSYRILINNIVAEDWSSDGYLAPMKIVRNYRPGTFVTGPNTITVEIRSNFKGNIVESSESISLVKNNNLPDLSTEIKGRNVIINSNDKDGDLLSFRILVNDTQVIPEQGYSMYFPTPLETEFVIPRDKININQINKVTIQVRDQSEDVATANHNVYMTYSGLLFSDPEGNYYTDDIGQLLKYLDIGTVLARETSDIYEVRVCNTLGYPVGNITLDPIYDDLDPVTEIIELSKTGGKDFRADQHLLYDEKVVHHGDYVTVFIRINALDGAAGGGHFRVIAKADPVIATWVGSIDGGSIDDHTIQFNQSIGEVVAIQDTLTVSNRDSDRATSSDLYEVGPLSLDEGNISEVVPNREVGSSDSEEGNDTLSDQTLSIQDTSYSEDSVPNRELSTPDESISDESSTVSEE